MCFHFPQSDFIMLDMGEHQQLYYLAPPPLPTPPAPPPQSAPAPTSEDPPPPSASSTGDKPPPPRFDPSRMVGIIRRKALIKDLVAVYHAECLPYCQELLELQKKLEESLMKDHHECFYMKVMNFKLPLIDGLHKMPVS